MFELHPANVYSARHLSRVTCQGSPKPEIASGVSTCSNTRGFSVTLLKN